MKIGNDLVADDLKDVGERARSIISESRDWTQVRAASKTTELTSWTNKELPAERQRSVDNGDDEAVKPKTSDSSKTFNPPRTFKALSVVIREVMVSGQPEGNTMAENSSSVLVGVCWEHKNILRKYPYSASVVRNAGLYQSWIKLVSFADV